MSQPEELKVFLNELGRRELLSSYGPPRKARLPEPADMTGNEELQKMLAVIKAAEERRKQP